MPPCGAVRGVVRPVRLVMSLFAPEAAAERAVLAAPAVVDPVPPLATFNVPARVTAPVVAVLGVNPVVPAVKEETLAGMVAATVIEPAAFVMVIFEPWVRVVRVKPVPFPISISPLAGVAVRPVPPLAIGSVPVTPVLPKGRPVALVKTRAEGVPRAGVTSVGDVERTLFPEPVLVVTPVPPLATARVPASVTAPVVAVAGVSPVEPALNEETKVKEPKERFPAPSVFTT